VLSVVSMQVFFYVSGDKGFKGHYATWASAVHGYAETLLQNIARTSLILWSTLPQHLFCG